MRKNNLLSVFSEKAYLNISKNKKQIFSLLVLAVIFSSCYLLNASSVKAGSLWDAQQGRTEIGAAFGENAGEARDVRLVVSEIIKVFLSFLGLLMVIIIIWGGFRWLTAGGNEKQVQEAKDTIIRALIGAAVIIAAYAITYFFAETIRRAVTGDIW